MKDCAGRPLEEIVGLEDDEYARWGEPVFS